MGGADIREHPDAHRDLVVIGASAGGVEVLRRVVKDLPADLPAAICIVLHVAPGSPSMLAQILGRETRLACRPAADGEQLREGVILVAPPDHHLVVEDGIVRLTAGPRENGHRPAIDSLFRSAARARESRVVGVVLTGTRDDGAAGLAAIKAHRGVAVVQDPNDAMYPDMPANAIAQVTPDAVVPAAQLAMAVAALVHGQDPPPTAPAAERDPDLSEGERVAAVCPECGGVLTERLEAGMLQWQCRIGHRYSPETLLDVQADHVEGALSAAIRALGDRAALLERMAGRAEQRGQTRAAQRFRRQSAAASEQADIVRQTLTGAARSALRRLSGGDEDRLSEQEDVA